MFPAEVGGWQKRQPYIDTDRTDLREVPLRMGFNTGIPGAPMSSGLFFVPKPKLTFVRNLAMRRHHNRKATMETLLLLEDESSVMKLVRHMLKQYNLIEATTAEQAIRLVNERDRRVHLLLADVTLPTSSGIQVALLLRSEIPDLPVILTSGYPVGDWTSRDSADLERLGSSSVAIIQKPFQRQVLLQTVRALIGEPQNELARTA